MGNLVHLPYRLRSLLLVLAAVLLAGCSLAPGMYMDNNYQTEPEPAVAASGVKPILRTITPELIQAEKQQDASKVEAGLSALIVPAQPYQIGPGDYLSITVWDHPELATPTASMTGGQAAGAQASGGQSPGYAVSDQGTIQFPYADDLKVAGLTELQARDQLVQRLSKFIRNPKVTLQVMGYRSKRVYVDGEIRKPGIVPIDDLPLSLPDAINRAGGITPLGDSSRISITSAGKVYWVDLTHLTQLGVDPTSIMLHNGDMVRVSPREESKVFVIGEVTKPVTLMLMNGRLSLGEALGEAGGVNPQTGNANQIYVIRNANDKQPTVYHLDGHSPVMFALADNFELKAQDVVYVDAAPMVRFNRILSLILPSAQAITIVNRGFQ
jgi:polysaccharide export outer membrane protein